MIQSGNFGVNWNQLLNYCDKELPNRMLTNSGDPQLTGSSKHNRANTAGICQRWNRSESPFYLLTNSKRACHLESSKAATIFDI